MNVASRSVTQLVPPTTVESSWREPLSAATVQLVKYTNPLVEIIEEHVQLRRSGRQLIGRCPFHESRSGRSFSVDAERGVWFCHGCRLGGDAITFYEHLHRVDFRGAVELLAIRVGIEVQEGAVSPELLERIRNERELREVERRIAEIGHAQFLRLSRLYDHARKLRRRVEIRMGQINGGALERSGESDINWSVLSDLISTSRRLDVAYCIVGLGKESDRIRFLRASREEQQSMIDAALDQGYVETDRGFRFEVSA